MTLRERDMRVAMSASQTAAAANSYARSGIVRIADFFSSDVAETLYRHLDTQLDWRRTVSHAGTALDLGPDLMAAMDSGQDNAIIAAAHENARESFQFVFDSVVVSDDADERKARDLLVDRLIAAFNHPASLELFRTLTGNPEIRLVNGQATRYLPGHFLTSHDDNVGGQDRIAAYVINLTKGWREDWGGMLQFHSANGDIPLALKPGFNAINLFRVPQVHSVSYVAPFAGRPRYSIIGWLRR